MRAERQERIRGQRCQSGFQHAMVGSERLQELRSAEGGQLALTSIAFFLCKNKGLLPAQSRVHHRCEGASASRQVRDDIANGPPRAVGRALPLTFAEPLSSGADFRKQPVLQRVRLVSVDFMS